MIDLPYNMGVGRHAHRLQVCAAHGLRHYQVDSDGQHHPGSIPSLIEAGRLRHRDVPASLKAPQSTRCPVRAVGDGPAVIPVHPLGGHPVHGRPAALRSLTAAVSTSTAVTCPPNIWATIDITAMAINNGLKVRQVPVNMRERQGGTLPPVR